MAEIDISPLDTEDGVMQIAIYQSWLEGTQEQVNEGLISSEKRDFDIASLLYQKDQEIALHRRDSYLDPLTQLPNRRSFDETYQQLIQEGNPFGMLIIDVDNLKQCNEDYGHGATDTILAQIALAMNTSIRHAEHDRKNDFLARYAGDEFVAFFPDMQNTDQLQHAADNLLTTVRRPISIHVDGVHTFMLPSVSIGGAMYDKSDPTVFFEKVDRLGLQKAKETGKGRAIILQ